jgi:hypothetical protein
LREKFGGASGSWSVTKIKCGGKGGKQKYFPKIIIELKNKIHKANLERKKLT